MSHKPGIINLPVPSTTCAPSGTRTLPARPTALRRSPVTITVWSGWAGAPGSVDYGYVDEDQRPGFGETRRGKQQHREHGKRAFHGSLRMPIGNCQPFSHSAKASQGFSRAQLENPTSAKRRAAPASAVAEADYDGQAGKTCAAVVGYRNAGRPGGMKRSPTEFALEWWEGTAGIKSEMIFSSLLSGR